MLRPHLLKALQVALVFCIISPPAVARHVVHFATASDGAQIAFYPLLEHGAGRVPVLVLSGGPGTDSRYMRVGGALDRLARTRPVILFDQRGTSRSSDSHGDETIDRYVEDVETVRKAIGSRKVDLLGHSFGGFLALAYTAKYPDRVRGLVLVSPPPPNINDLIQVTDAHFPDRIEAWRVKRSRLGKSNPASEYEIFQSMEFVDRAALKRFLKAVKHWRYNMEVNNTLRRDMAKLDYTAQVHRFSQPALVICGRWDPVIPPSNGWKLHEMLPHAGFTVIEGAGHLPHVERPGAFLRVVRPFFTSLDQKSLLSSGRSEHLRPETINPPHAEVGSGNSE